MRIEDEIQQTQFASVYHKLAINILFTGHWLREKTSRQLKPFGLTPQQFNILRIARGQSPEGATISTLRDRMLDKQSDASRLIERLRQKGLLRRTISRKDRRSCKVTITDKGLKLLKKIDANEPLWHRSFKIVDESEAEIMNSLLDKIRGSYD